MGPLETLLRPVADILNRNISETTPARELCDQLDGKTIAVRVRDTALAVYFEINDRTIALATDSRSEPDTVVTGSLLTLARLAAGPGDVSVRNGTLELTGDAATAEAFQELLAFAKPDIEEEMSGIVGDAAAHRLGEIVKGIGNWAQDARSTMGAVSTAPWA